MLDINCEDTICALSTPQGTGGISVIRLSGSQAKAIILKLCPKWCTDPEDHKAYFTHILDEDGNRLDEVILTYFAHGKSYTGEQTVEISCHGSPLICSEILRSLVASGARPAQPGEFSFRAFVNQKLDLVQTESVLSMIESKSKSSAKLAFRQLKGELSLKIQELEDKITFLLANFEASIDFSTEDIEVIDYSKASDQISELAQEFEKLLASYKSGRALRSGIQVALVGAPNAGKSSLLNALLKEDKAIVSDTPGTTRDVVEGSLQYGGVEFKFFDTAGIHETEDQVEKIGIEKSRKALVDSDIILFLVDSLQGPSQKLLDSLKAVEEQEMLFVLTKADRLGQESEKTNQKNARELFNKKLNEYLAVENLQSKIQSKISKEKSSIFTSIKTDAGLEELIQFLQDKATSFYSEESAVLSQARHFDLIRSAYASLLKSQELINVKESAEFISFELHESIFKLHEVLGKRFDDEVMDRVFKEFCIGK